MKNIQVIALFLAVVTNIINCQNRVEKRAAPGPTPPPGPRPTLSPGSGSTPPPLPGPGPASPPGPRPTPSSGSGPTPPPGPGPNPPPRPGPNPPPGPRPSSTNSIPSSTQPTKIPITKTFPTVTVTSQTKTTSDFFTIHLLKPKK